MFLDLFRMGLKHTLCLLLCVAALTDYGVSGTDGNREVNRWTKQNLPLLLDTHTQLLNTPLFRGQVEDEEKGEAKPVCGIECQSGLLPMDQTEQERILGYETMYENGTRTHTDVSFQGFSKTSTGFFTNTTTKTRWKRQVYGADGSFVISGSHFITKYPFSAAVRLSTNCTGVLISPKHVLTAAHCIHNGRSFIGRSKGLKVGFLQLKNKRRGRGRREGKGGKRDRKNGSGNRETYLY